MNVDSVWHRDASGVNAIEEIKHLPPNVPTSTEAHDGDPTITEPAMLRRNDWNINLPPGVDGHSQMAVRHAVQQAVYKRRALLDEGVVPTTATSTNAEAATEIPEQNLPHEITAGDKYIDQTADVVYLAETRHAESPGPDIRDSTLSRRLDQVVHNPASGIYKAAENVQEDPKDEARYTILPRSDRIWPLQEPQWNDNSRDSPDSDNLFSLKVPFPVTHQLTDDIWRRTIELKDDEEPRSRDAHHGVFNPDRKPTPIWPPEMLGPRPVAVERENQGRGIPKSVDAWSSHVEDDATLDPANNAATIFREKANDVWRRNKPYTTVSSSRSISTDESSSKPEAEELFDQSTSALQGVNRHNNIVEIHHPAPMIYRRSSTQWQPQSINEGSWDEKPNSSNKDDGGILPAENGIVSAASMDSVTIHPVLDVYRRQKATSPELANYNQLQTMHEISVFGARSPRENNDDEPDERFGMPTLGEEATAHEPAHHLYKFRTQQGRKRSVPAPQLFEYRPWPYRSNRVMRRQRLNGFGTVKGDIQDDAKGLKNTWDKLDKGGISGMQKRISERLPSTKPGISLVWEKRSEGGYGDTRRRSNDAWDVFGCSQDVRDKLQIGGDVEAMKPDGSVSFSNKLPQRRSMPHKDASHTVMSDGREDESSTMGGRLKPGEPGMSMSDGATTEDSNTSSSSNMDMSNSVGSNDVDNISRRGIVTLGNEVPDQPPGVLSHLSARGVGKVQTASLDCIDLHEGYIRSEGPAVERRSRVKYITDPRNGQTANPASFHGTANSIWRARRDEGEHEFAISQQTKEFDNYRSWSRANYGVNDAVSNPAVEMGPASSVHRREQIDGSSFTSHEQKQTADEQKANPLPAVDRDLPSYDQMYTKRRLSLFGLPQNLARPASNEARAPARGVDKCDKSATQYPEPEYLSDAWYEKYCLGDLTIGQWMICYGRQYAVQLPIALEVHRRSERTDMNVERPVRAGRKRRRAVTRRLKVRGSRPVGNEAKDSTGIVYFDTHDQKRTSCGAASARDWNELDVEEVKMQDFHDWQKRDIYKGPPGREPHALPIASEVFRRNVDISSSCTDTKVTTAWDKATIPMHNEPTDGYAVKVGVNKARRRNPVTLERRSMKDKQLKEQIGASRLATPGTGPHNYTHAPAMYVGRDVGSDTAEPFKSKQYPTVLHERGILDKVMEFLGIKEDVKSGPQPANESDSRVDPSGSVHMTHTAYQISSVFKRNMEDEAEHADTSVLKSGKEEFPVDPSGSNSPSAHFFGGTPFVHQPWPVVAYPHFGDDEENEKRRRMKRNRPNSKAAEDTERLDPATPHPDYDIRPNNAETPATLQPAPNVSDYNARPTRQDTKIRRRARDGTSFSPTVDKTGPQKRTSIKSSPDFETNKPSSDAESTRSNSHPTYLVGSEAWTHGLANEVAQLPSLDGNDGAM
jgi:hypothetical protein